MHLESSPNVCWCAPAVLVMQLLSSSVRSHLVFIRPTQSIFQYSFFVCILLPIISNILVCAILLTYSAIVCAILLTYFAITSGDKTCVTFFLAWHLAFLWHWIWCGLAWASYSYASTMNAAPCSCCVDHLLLCTQLLVALASAYSICLVYLFLLCHLGNVKYQN